MRGEDESVIRAIERMQRDVALGPEIYRPGEFWTDLLARNIEMIRDSGIATSFDRPRRLKMKAPPARLLIAYRMANAKTR